MSKVKIEWKVDDGHTPSEARAETATAFVVFQEIGCHLIFDVMMDFTRKARFVARGNTTEAPSSTTYSSVVSRDSVRLAFTIAALNGVDVMPCDLENTYLNAMCRKKIWFKGGTECGEDKGKVLIVVRELYGFKSAVLSWRAALEQVLKDLDFVSTLADPDVWIQYTVREDGLKYYEMLFVYVENILAVLHKSTDVIKEVTEFYRAKEGSINPPDIYLVADIMKVQIPDGYEVCGSSSRDYVKNEVITIERLFEKNGESYTLRDTVKAPSPL